MSWYCGLPSGLRMGVRGLSIGLRGDTSEQFSLLYALYGRISSEKPKLQMIQVHEPTADARISRFKV